MIFSFLICSGLAAVANILTGQFLYVFLGLSHGWQYSFSVSAAFLVGMAVSFCLNRRYTFKPSGRRISREGADFMAVSFGGLLLTTGVAQVLYSRADIALAGLGAMLPLPVPPETLAHVSAVAITGIYSFTAHKYISFRRAHAV